MIKINMVNFECVPPTLNSGGDKFIKVKKP